MANAKATVLMPGVTVPPAATFDHAIVFPGAKIEEGECVKNEIRGEGFRWSIGR